MRPTPKIFRLLLIGLALALIIAVWPEYKPIWDVAAPAFLLVLLIDGIRLYKLPLPELKRRMDTALPLGVWCDVRIRLENKHEGPIHFRLHDFYPREMEFRHLPLEQKLEPMQYVEHEYRVKPSQRGLKTFEPAQILLTSPFGLWERSARIGDEQQVKVYPNFQAVASYTLMDMGQRLTQIGIHRRQRRGEGREFHQLREFVQGDPLRHIDWKASSRMRKVISREYRDERDQQVIFLMDSGQSMRAKDGLLGHFDHALNAVLLMTNVALRHGDAVGLMTFSGEQRWLAARKGTGQMNLILNNIYDIQPGLQTSDFMGMAHHVLSHVRKRALLVVLTNLKDEDNDELRPALRLLQRKHLVLMASMRERILQDTLEKPIDNFQDALTLAATHTYMQRRRQSYEVLRSQGILCVDTQPDELPIALVNSYLDIKSRGIL